MKVHEDESFEIFEGRWVPRSTCNAAQPGVIDFPARCVAVPWHVGQPHTTAEIHSGKYVFPPITWTEDE